MSSRVSTPIKRRRRKYMRKVVLLASVKKSKNASYSEPTRFQQSTWNCGYY
jgi:hypothetical protein